MSQPTATEKNLQESPAQAVAFLATWQTGVTSAALRTLEQQLRTTNNPAPLLKSLRRSSPELGELALEAGFYDLAYNLGVYSGAGDYHAEQA